MRILPAQRDPLRLDSGGERVTRTMKCSTAGLTRGDTVTVIDDSMPPFLTVLDANGAEHLILEGDTE